METLCFCIEAKQLKQTVSKQTEKNEKNEKNEKTKKPKKPKKTTKNGKNRIGWNRIFIFPSRHYTTQLIDELFKMYMTWRTGIY
jgi:hypothetical protein